MSTLLEPFAYVYMIKAMCAAGTVGLLCGVLSVFIMLRGWSLIGDALAHSVVPGVAIAASLALPLSLGAFISGALAALAMLIIHSLSHLRSDAVIGFVFTSFLGLGIFVISVAPSSVSVQTIIFGSLLAIDNAKFAQLIGLAMVSMIVIGLGWRNFMLMFFDEGQAQMVGLPLNVMKIGFFAILSGATIIGMMTVGAFLVVALIIIPGATVYLMTDRFGWLIILSGLVGAVTSVLATYMSFFLETSVGGLIILVQTSLFIIVFLFAPKRGYFALGRLKQKPINERLKG